MAYKPFWKNRGGSTVDTSSMSRIATIKVAELEPYVEAVTGELEMARTKLIELERLTAEAQQQLTYWTTMKAIAAEIDTRLEMGEEVQSGDVTEVG